MVGNQFQFVVSDRPDQLKASKTRKLKSHIAKRGWASYRAASSSTSSSAKSSAASNPARTPLAHRPQVEPKVEEHTDGELQKADDGHVARRTYRRRNRITVTFEWTDHQSHASAYAHATTQTQTPSEEPPPLPPIEYQLGGGRADPFQAHPGQRRPYVPALIDHYIIHMAVDIPELDQPGSRGLLRSSWFPLVLSDPACFAVVMLLSASNFTTHNKLTGLTDQLLQLKASAIDLINQDLACRGTSSRYLSDGTIGAVAKMASFEAMHGDVASYSVHMQGLRHMIELRGGMKHLGLDDLLRRIVVWIDLNSSFLLNTQRFFPGQYFAMTDDTEPNPVAFTAP